jgi:GT2 family glycosyltransferase
MKFAALYCVYHDHEYLDLSVLPIAKHVDKVLFLMNDKPWNGDKINNLATIMHIEDLCNKYKHFELIQSHWNKEIDLRNEGLGFLSNKYDFTFIIDSDELFHEYQFVNLKKFIELNSNCPAFHIEMNTYWKDFYTIWPREPYKPLIAVKTNQFYFNYVRQGTTAVMRNENIVIQTDEQYKYLIVPENVAVMHHLSYARSDEFIKQKMQIASHNSEFIPNWYENVWLKWHKDMINLHPVKPDQYHKAIKSDFSTLPDQLRTYLKSKKLRNRTCSIVILNWDSLELLKRCVNLIEKNTLRANCEVIIVDNGSKDGSAEFLKSLKKNGQYSVKILLSEKNVGFPAGVNLAMRMTSNSDICLLNVDADVQYNWLNEMYETMINISDCGMVGPLGNNVPSRHQSVGYVKVDTKVPNLYGYCLLIARELIDKIGYFDEQFFPGQYEDNDYCIRAKLAGYETYISAKSLVLHEPHQTFDSHKMNMSEIDMVNREKYLNKFFGVLLNYGRIHNLYSDGRFAEIAKLKIR